MKVGTANLINAEHHWWPKSLSRFWAGADNMVTRFASDGVTLRQEPWKFGGIKGGHNLKLGPIWSSTIEPVFSPADEKWPYLVPKLLNLNPRHLSTGDLHDRCVWLTRDQEMSSQLADGIASLIARSPRYRELIRLTVDSYGMYESSGGVGRRHALIAANINGAYQGAKNLMTSSGCFFLLFSEEVEFLYGDGTFGSFGISDANFGHCIVPITPNLAVAYSTIQGGYVQGLRCATLTSGEADAINRATQVYSKDYLFSRRPECSDLTPEFTSGEHLEYEYHRLPLMSDLCELTRYGRERPSTDWVRLL